MNSQTCYIVYQCYGNEGVFLECTYSLLSLSRIYGPGGPVNTEIWIYTDNPDWFKGFADCTLQLNFRHMDRAIINLWRGEIDFVHRVKIELLKDFTSKKAGNILYTDTDVVFTSRIDNLFEDISAGKLFMHVREGCVNGRSSPVLKKLNRYLTGRTHQPVNGKQLFELDMWNAGVLGFNTSYKPLLDKVLVFTDIEYPQFSKHIVEQFAFSVYFQEAGAIHAAAPYMLHYWNLKEVRLVLGAFFRKFKSKHWQELTQLIELLQLPVLMQDKVNFYQNRSILDKLLKKEWEPSDQHWPE